MTKKEMPEELKENVKVILANRHNSKRQEFLNWSARILKKKESYFFALILKKPSTFDLVRVENVKDGIFIYENEGYEVVDECMKNNGFGEVLGIWYENNCKPLRIDCDGVSLDTKMLKEFHDGEILANALRLHGDGNFNAKVVIIAIIVCAVLGAIGYYLGLYG